MAGTIAYIDGLNLYYGALRNRPSLKWLNPQVMLAALLPGENFSAYATFPALWRDSRKTRTPLPAKPRTSAPCKPSRR